MRIWFNHWFSTAYHLIQLMRADEDVTVIGSNRNSDAIYRFVCDEWEQEPTASDNTTYVDKCLQFCTNHAVDVFVPRHALSEIAAARDSFESSGTHVLCSENAELIRILDDKSLAYKYFSERGLEEWIPPYAVANSFSEFKHMCCSLSSRFQRICYKLVRDEGAVTFRVLDSHLEDISSLRNAPNQKISLHTACKILEQYDFSVSVLIMPYLKGPEISVDCLKTNTGWIIIPRFKRNHRYTDVNFDIDIMRISKRILECINISAPLNLQFRMNQGKPFLLEINPRMSGGLQLSCIASGINIPNLALHELLNDPKEWSYPEKTIHHVAQIESPILIERMES